MTKQIAGVENKQLAMLEWSLKWEHRIFVAVPLGGAFYVNNGYEVVAFGICGVTAFCLGFFDTVFNITAVAIFLKPLKDVLNIKVGQASDATLRMKRVEAATFTGASLIVIGTTILYVDLVIFSLSVMYERYFMLDSPYLHPFVVLGSVSNIILGMGVFVASGMLGVLRNVGGKIASSSASRMSKPRNKIAPGQQQASLGDGNGKGTDYVPNPSSFEGD